MLSVTKRPIFKTAILSSVVLLGTLFVFERLWSEARAGCALLIAVAGLFYIVTLLWTVVFWIEKRHYRIPYVPFCISLLAGLMAYGLPLSRICDDAEFAVLHNKYDKVANLALQSRGDTNVYNYRLPHKYRRLSVGGGDAVVVQNKDARAVMFYTFRDAERSKGFIKLAKGQNIGECARSLYNEVDSIKPMGHNWYYVAGE